MIKTTISLISFLLLITITSSASAQTTTDYLVNWEPNPEPDITGYVIYRSLDRNTGFEAIDSVGNATFSYIDENLEKGVRYYYRLIAKNSSGNRSGFSNPVSGMAIPDDAPQSMKDSCDITVKSRIENRLYELNWETPVQTTGFIQYDIDATLDSTSTWDDTQYATSHSTELQDLQLAKYYVKAVAYDSYDNLTISSLDSFTVEDEDPTPVSSPQLSIYPVPYHPVQGTMNMVNLPVGGSVRIFNSNGVEVYTEDVGANGEVQWDGVNHNGSKVASGVYYVLVNDSKGETISRKPIMIVN